MTTKTDFTESEWAALQKGVTGSGFLVSLSDRDLSDTFGEVGAMAKYVRSWKLVTLAIGIALLIAGSIYTPAPDWDIPISLIMAVLAYFAAPWSLHVIVERRWRLWPAMLFATWFTVDGCYWLYWHFRNPEALDQMRDANFLASLELYGLCGLVWFYRGTLRELVANIRALSHMRG